ncbi:GNAT family N-acetyltransferase [Gracilibacillus timonensis]|uniref:GNAT family N-acetyltransferase n=1 Tax=Gracilibacillus timonensis TaxID=1816696 RepID=UPI000AF87449|nr:GNAT family protein [Gracilibacillus timonensis]
MVHNNISISNGRVFLREIIESDWNDIHEYASQEMVCQYQPWGPNTIEDTKNFVNQIMEEANNEKLRTRYVFAIIEKANKRLIGAGEFNIRDSFNRNGEIAYIVNPKYWGKGIATEVANLIIDYGFKEHKMHRIFATCDPRNIGSSKVLQKVGMIQEGKIREDLLIKDGWRDSLLYSILKHEWQIL